MSTPAPERDDEHGGLTRRHVVLGGALASVGLVAACSTASTAGTTPGTPGTTAPAPSPSATSGPPATGTVLGAVSQVPVGEGAIFTVGDQAVVVTQPSAGVFEGFSAVCPHEGCNCNEVVDGEIRCPCHKSRFAITDGSVTRGPARSGLAPLAVAVQGSDVVLA